MKQPNTFIGKDKAATLLKKWAPLLEHSSKTVAPITDDHTRLSTAILLENQEQYLNENIVAGQGGAFGQLQPTAGAFSGDRYATGDARLPKVLIPMIRRTFPELITNEIVGVQPMSGPVGLAFALRFKYEADPLGDFKYDGSAVQSAVAGTYQTGAIDPSTGLPVTVTPDTRAWRQRAGGYEVGWNYLDTAFTGASSQDLLSAIDSIEAVDAQGNPLPDATFPMVEQDAGVAELLSNFELTANIPQMTLDFFKTAVEAGTRRLAARWSVELEQDIKNMNGIDVDNELTNAMSYEIQAEIDREMIMRMVKVAANAGPVAGYSSWSPASADARWLGERNRDFYQKIIVEANRIAIRNRRGAANFIIATPRVCSILEMLPEFQFMQVNGNVNTQPVGIARVGNLGGRFQVYRDTRTEAQFQVGQRSDYLEYALLGYKGPEYYDTGIVYCPYIPVMVQRTIAPNDFSPRVGLMTRYGVVDHIFGASLYYHLIIVRGLGITFQPFQAATYL
jgi:hypothetical protein